MIQRQILKPKGQEFGILDLGGHMFRHTYRSLLDETGAAQAFLVNVGFCGVEKPEMA
jgi:integrase